MAGPRASPHAEPAPSDSVLPGKPRGINAARKLRTCRRQNRWAQKSYKKAHLGTQFKCNPFGGSSHCKGIVLEKMWAPPRIAQSLWSGCWRAQRPERELHGQAAAVVPGRMGFAGAAETCV